MHSLMPFVITEIATGSIYAPAALGPVPTHKTSGVARRSDCALDVGGSRHG